MAALFLPPGTERIHADSELVSATSDRHAAAVTRALRSTSPRGRIASKTRGWRLNARNIGLAAYGLSCDALPVYDGPAKPPAGTRIRKKLVTVPLDLSNGDIRIVKSCVRPTTTGGHNNFLVTTTRCESSCQATARGGVIIRDSEISGLGMGVDQIAKSCGFLGVATLKRNLIHGMGSGICFFETGRVHPALAEQNYVTGLRASGDSHNEAATVRDFDDINAKRRVVFLNNRLSIDIEGHTSGGLFIQPTWISIYHLDVIGNLIEGIGWNLFITSTLPGESGTYDDFRAINNRFGARGYGASSVDSGDGWDVWSRNHLYNPARPGARGTAVRR